MKCGCPKGGGELKKGHILRGANVCGVAILIYGWLQKLWIYGQVKIAMEKLFGKHGCLGQRVSILATELHISRGASLMSMQLNQL